MENYMCVTLGDCDTLEDGHKTLFVNPLILEGDDGGKSHAIATVQNCIFDSNCEFAMKLNKENLNWYVSSDDVECKFVRVHWGLVSFHSYPLLSLGSCVFAEGEHHSVILVLFVWSFWLQ